MILGSNEVVLLTLKQQSYGAPREELIAATARHLGCGTLTSGVRDALAARVQALLEAQRVEERAGMLTRVH